MSFLFWSSTTFVHMSTRGSKIQCLIIYRIRWRLLKKITPRSADDSNPCFFKIFILFYS